MVLLLLMSVTENPSQDKWSGSYIGYRDYSTTEIGQIYNYRYLSLYRQVNTLGNGSKNDFPQPIKGRVQKLN